MHQAARNYPCPETFRKLHELLKLDVRLMAQYSIALSRPCTWPLARSAGWGLCGWLVGLGEVYKMRQQPAQPPAQLNQGIRTGCTWGTIVWHGHSTRIRSQLVEENTDIPDLLVLQISQVLQVV